MSTANVDRRFLIGALSGAAGVAALSRVAQAGPLNPPPGPIGPTGRTVQEIFDKVARTDVGLAEPRIPVQSLPGSATAMHVISQPGSYYLTRDVEATAGRHGIQVLSSNVSLDLSGFALRGNGSGQFCGVHAPSFVNVAVRNGHCDFWGACGLLLGFNALATGICVLNSGEDGVRIATGTVVNCVSRGNARSGIIASGATIIGCRSEANQGTGIHAAFGSLVTQCSADGNRTGFDIQQESAAIDCIARASTEDGFLVRDRSRVVGCASFGHVHGFYLLRSVCEDCQAHNGSSAGFAAPSAGACLAIRNRASGNSSNFSFAAGNAFGPIVNVAGVGNISAVAAANHPWANFIY